MRDPVRLSQLQVRAFANSQLQPKTDRFVNRQQNPTETNTLRHVLTDLADGLRAGTMCSGSPPLSGG